jgi:Copper type II ascorbate-dependent monooxygenase, C-terminal domain
MFYLVLPAFILFACGGNGDSTDISPQDAPALEGEKHSLQFGPLIVRPGEEGTRCVNLRLSNSAAIKVHQMRNTLSGGSHHLILYKDDMETVEKPTPYDCQPFTGALNLSGMIAPVMITQKHEDALTLPDRVAYTFSASQMIRIEMHYINATDADIAVNADVEFYAVPESKIDHEANILFIGTPDISIPAGAMMDVQAYFAPGRAQLDLTGAKFFAITGHTHQHGLQVTVGTAATSGAARTMVYDPRSFSWSEPETTVHAPGFMIPSGGGFDVKCSYHNTSNQTAEFGESANDEMCFFWAYYYPSKGSHVCIHTTRFGGIDVCCPEAGPTVCDFDNL